jgi:amidase
MGEFREYAEHDATGLAALLRAGELSREEVIEAALARAEALEPQLNAFAHLDAAAARAAVVDVREDAPLAGVPFAVKDLWLEWAGAPHGAGSRWLRDDHRFDRDAPLAAAFRAAGLVSLGKTTTPEFGITGTTEPARTGPTRNPWKLDRIAGGSSGGSAAAVAAGVVPVAHASDGAGSIRIPAACCGLVGLKPSRGRTLAPCDALDVPFAFSANFVVSRTVRDSAALLDVARSRSRYAPPGPDGTFAQDLGRDPGTLVIAASCETPSGRPVDPEIARAFEATCALLERLGHRVELREPAVDWRAFYRAFGSVGGAQLAADVKALETELGRAPLPAEFEPLTRRNVEAGRARSGVGLIGALRELQRCTRQLERFLEEVDLFLTPVLGTPVPELGYLDPTVLEPAEQDRRSARVFPFTPPCNASGQPAISLPLLEDDEGLPIGMQFAAAYGDDGLLLRLAAQLEAETGWVDRRPPLAGGQS